MAQIIGLHKVKTKLNNLERVLDISEPLQEACLLVETSAKKKCPVGETGELRNSLTHQVVGDVGYVGTNLLYAPYVEFGTGIFAEGGKGRKDVPWVYCDAKGQFHSTYGMKPNPYLRPALDENREMIEEIFKIFIQRELG